MSLVRTLHVFRGCGLFRPRLLHFTSPNLAKTQPSPTRNPLRRVVRYFKNDPFARVSIMFGGTVLIVLLIIEAMIPKQHKKVKPQIGILPPTVTHPTIQRQSHLSSLLSFLPSKIFSLSPSVVVVTGPSGSGKTELIRQFASRFIEISTPRISKKESLKPIVIYIDCSKPHPSDIDYVTSVLGLTVPYDTPPLEVIFNKLGEQKARWLLVLDGFKVDDHKIVSMLSHFLEGVVSNHKLRKGCIVIASEEEEEVVGVTKKHVSLKNG